MSKFVHRHDITKPKEKSENDKIQIELYLYQSINCIEMKLAIESMLNETFVTFINFNSIGTKNNNEFI